MLGLPPAACGQSTLGGHVRCTDINAKGRFLQTEAFNTAKNSAPFTTFQSKRGKSNAAHGTDSGPDYKQQMLKKAYNRIVDYTCAYSRGDIGDHFVESN